MKPEILAPCGDFSSLEAAVKSGADAVYFGAEDFNARRNAENFTGEELKKAITYCRARGVKCHLALNTLLHDDELKRAADTAVFAAQCGIDAVIVQDIGLAGILRQIIPDIPLHASTQLTIHEENGLKAAKKLGFSRAVLSRELSFEEIKRICASAEKIGIETEVFVHGALCMCMSGQCYLSAMLGGRSGNRGLCAQPCRLPFSAGKDGGYALSLKDMSHLRYLRELASIGVSSFKIEGRMKNPEYVASAVFAARQSLDRGFIDRDTSEMLRKVFSRSGFTDGYYKSEFGKSMFGIRRTEDFEITKQTEKSVHSLYRGEYQRIPVSFVLNCEVGKPASLFATDGLNSATVYGSIPVTVAQNTPIDVNYATKCLSKCGGTPFYLENAELNGGKNAMLPMSELNNLRKAALDKLFLLRSAPPEIKIGKINPLRGEHRAVKSGSSQRIFARFDNMLPSDISALDRIYLTHGSADGLFERAVASGCEVGAELPRTLFCGDGALRKRLLRLKKLGVKYALCENIGTAVLAQELGFETCGGMFMQICNSASVFSAKKLGLGSVTVSFENTLAQSKDMAAPIQKGAVFYGYLPLMLTRNCPLKNGRKCRDCEGGYLTDRKNVKFFVKCRDGASEIFNFAPLDMRGKTGQLADFDFLLFYFTRESAGEADEILKSAHSADYPKGEFTRGLYYRGVL
ncbi:MAG: U32 family peptidase [Acutalibacteraceae bacterium]